MFAVFMLDLDRFKDVNDSLGHPAGDTLLKDTALRLKAVLSEEPRSWRGSAATNSRSCSRSLPTGARRRAPRSPATFRKTAIAEAL